MKVYSQIGLLITVVLFTGLVFMSSQWSYLSPSKYKKWVLNPENGLFQKQVHGDKSFSLLYKPIDYMVALELQDKPFNTEILERKRAEYGDMHYFNFRISGNQLNLAEQTAYLSHAMKKDFKLVMGESDTLDCTAFQYVNNFQLSPHYDFVLAFENRQKVGEQDMTLLYKDNLLEEGDIAFPIEQQVIQSANNKKLN